MIGNKATRNQAQQLRRKAEIEDRRRERLAADAIIRAQTRASMTPEQMAIARETYRVQHVQRRAFMSEDALAAAREIHQIHEAQRRKSMSKEETAKAVSVDALASPSGAMRDRRTAP
jgi:hypothetical protein